MQRDTRTLGGYLQELREDARLSLRQVERLLDGAVSNVYLSQLETGRREDPNPRLLVRLAKLYGIPVTGLFERAGYLDEPDYDEIDRAYAQVMADTRFQWGTRFRGRGDFDQADKRAIIELYERATGTRLLDGGGGGYDPDHN